MKYPKAFWGVISSEFLGQKAFCIHLLSNRSNPKCIKSKGVLISKPFHNLHPVSEPHIFWTFPQMLVYINLEKRRILWKLEQSVWCHFITMKINLYLLFFLLLYRLGTSIFFMETSSSNAQPLYLQFIGNPTRNQFKAQDLMPTRHQFLKVEAELLVSHKKLGVSILPKYMKLIQCAVKCIWVKYRHPIRCVKVLLVFLVSWDICVSIEEILPPFCFTL